MNRSHGSGVAAQLERGGELNRRERKDHKGEREEGDFEQIPMPSEAGHHAA